MLLGNAVKAQLITYDDVQPILQQHCLSCHKKEGIAPITFDSYIDVVKSSQLIKWVIQSGYMPPWRPDTTYSHFLGERILPETEKRKMLLWINAKCPKGMLKNGVNEHQSVKHKTDVSFVLPFDIHIKAGMADTNVWVELPYELPYDTFVSSYDFLSKQKGAIHHAMFVVNDLSDPLGSDYYEADFFDGKQMQHRIFNINVLSLMGGWVPGSTAYSLPKGVGYYLPKKGIIAFQIHYGPPVKSFDDNITINLRFSDKPVSRIVQAKKYGSQGGICEPYPPLLVPPDTVMHFSLEAPIDENVSLLAVEPHMHLLGKKIKAWIIQPNGDTLPLIRINDWDFNWQDYYHFPHLLKIPKGSMFQAEAILDNTLNNIRNPNNPPRFVRDGDDTKDEMIQMSILFVRYREGDEQLHTEVVK